MKKEQRFCLLQDDDGHDYIVPVERIADFEKWLGSEAAQDGEMPKWADKFGCAPSCLSFTDPLISYHK